MNRKQFNGKTTGIANTFGKNGPPASKKAR